MPATAELKALMVLAGTNQVELAEHYGYSKNWVNRIVLNPELYPSQAHEYRDLLERWAFEKGYRVIAV